MSSRSSHWLALLIAVAVVAGGNFGRPWQNPDYVPRTLIHAQNLMDQGMFSGRFRPRGEELVPGRDISPGYPAVLAAIGLLDPEVASDIRCFADKRNVCQPALPFASLIVLQVSAGVLILVLVYMIALLVGGSSLVGYATAVAFERGAKLGEYGGLLRQDNILNVLLVGGLLLALLALRHRSIFRFALSGAAFGLAGYFYTPMPCLVVLAPLVVALVIWLQPGLRAYRRFAIWGGLAFAVCGLAVLAPWAVRNWLLFGDPAFSMWEGTVLLATRAAFNAITVREFGAAIVHWLPTLGNNVTEFLMAPDLTAKLDLGKPGTYTTQGRQLADRLLLQGVHGEHPYAVLWQNYVVGDLFRYLAVTPALAWRGVWGTHSIVGLIGLALVPSLIRTRSARCPPKQLCFQILLAMSLSMLAVNSLFTENRHWSNVLMLVVMSLAIGHAFRRLLIWLDKRFLPQGD